MLFRSTTSAHLSPPQSTRGTRPRDLPSPNLDNWRRLWGERALDSTFRRLQSPSTTATRSHLLRRVRLRQQLLPRQCSVCAAPARQRSVRAITRGGALCGATRDPMSWSSGQSATATQRCSAHVRNTPNLKKRKVAAAACISHHIGSTRTAATPCQLGAWSRACTCIMHRSNRLTPLASSSIFLTCLN